MSRIGKQPIDVPAGVEVKVDGDRVLVKGSKGELEVRIPALTSVDVQGGVVECKRADDTKVARANHGLVRANLANAVAGVTKGFEKQLEIIGTGYRAEVKGRNLELLLGFSHPIVFEPPEGVECRCDGNTKVIVSGYDKIKVGQAAADIRRFRPPEPYKGKGIRYVDEHVRRKAGKSGAAA